MHGNVAEWCEDSWHKNYISHPDDGSAWVLPDNNRKVNKGGSWFYPISNCRIASPDYFSRDNIYHCIGFRVICEIL